MAKGFFTNDIFENIRCRMKKVLEKDGAYLDDEYYCFHHPEARNKDYLIDCECRKPKSGLLYQAAKEHRVDLTHSWMIGDGLVDVEAGNKAGCKTILLGRMKCELCHMMNGSSSRPDAIAQNLLGAVSVISDWEVKNGNFH
jgi:histidinol-phosphate phosphatase family protein